MYAYSAGIHLLHTQGSTLTPEDVQITYTMTSHGTADLYLDHVQIGSLMPGGNLLLCNTA